MKVSPELSPWCVLLSSGVLGMWVPLHCTVVCSTVECSTLFFSCDYSMLGCDAHAQESRPTVEH
jgi:hypothetical protein